MAPYRSRASYRKKQYSGAKPSRKKVQAQLKRLYGEGVSSSADVRRVKNPAKLSFMKCVKCGSTNETDLSLIFYKFPHPNLGGNSRIARSWAEYCWPDKALTSEELMTVHKEKQLVCSQHFPDKETAKRYKLHSGIPIDLPMPIEEEKNNKPRTYGTKGAGKTESNTTSERVKPRKHSFLQAEKKLTKENKVPEHDFLEGENGAELFETIDEVFEDGADISFYDGPIVKIEPGPLEENSDPLLHDGYKCDHCLSSIRGYRYTCVECDDVDLCAACEASGEHAAHYVLRVPRPCPEEEVEELLKELREILKKRPITVRPAAKIIKPSNSMPAIEDPLQGGSLVARSAAQSESESESDTESATEKNTSPPPKNSKFHGLTCNEGNEIASPKRRKLEQKTADSTVTCHSSTITKHNSSKEQTKKCISLHNFDVNSDTDEDSHQVEDGRSNNDDTPKEKPNVTALEADLSLETVQQVEGEIKAELEPTDDNVDLEIADGINLRKGVDDLDENDGLLYKAKKRGREEGLNTEHLEEMLDEEPLDFVLQSENFSEVDPLETKVSRRVRKKANIGKLKVWKNENVEVLKRKNDRKYVKRSKTLN